MQGLHNSVVQNVSQNGSNLDENDQKQVKLLKLFTDAMHEKVYGVHKVDQPAAAPVILASVANNINQAID